ncbi:alpha-1,2-fucosyltransferase [Iocasia frigidifontis]|uniref:Alpha-1,2-fucosyltransferase n=1 Tax=Iocasia fonsfrigidae TaxID=2682810 RepID=A0A8A7KDM4_9FIRM|nr:alpha-1,2-fucosyltransferase [Iocasia fonsfrigidae]QTL97698.1 alpha-1,2-fucosyltransferase [Iocasia fonsfrigidae]
MKIVRITGGLGNQMFQYAFYLSLKERFTDVKLDITPYILSKFHYGYELSKVFGIKADLAINEEIDYLINNSDSKLSTIFIERQFNFDKEVFEIKGDVLYYGYWQTEKYFKSIDGIIKKEFVFKRPLDNKNIEIVDQINEVNSVSLHIRRGDYVSIKNVARICTLEYYQKAVKLIKEKINKPVFYICSDEIEWVKENIRLEENTVFVDWNKGEDSYKDMQLMSLCKHNILANSSFSWWAAWLNNNKNKMVIAPSRWFNDETENIRDLIPDGWFKIEV